MKNAVIVGNDTAMNHGLVADLKEGGYSVYPAWVDHSHCGEYCADPLSADSMFQVAAHIHAPLDLLVININATFDDPKASILDAIDFEAIKKAYDYNTLGVIRVINAFLPLLEEGKGKRIAVITNRESSNNAANGYTAYGDHVAHAPLNMAMNQLFNGFRPEGYTFRMYVRSSQDGYDPFAAEYILRNRSNEPESYKHSDENRLVLRDSMNLEIPW